MLDPAAFTRQLQACTAITPVVAVHDVLDSTNSACLAHAAQQPLRAPYVCLAAQQTAGRGRRGRVWDSPPEAGLYLSVAWRIARLDDWQGLSLAVGVVVVQALESAFGVPGLTLKWPNDILLGGAKLGGVLIEVGRDAAGETVLVTGVGLNRQPPAGAGEPANPRAWLTDVLPVLPAPEALAGVLAAALLQLGQDFAAQGGFAAYRAAWEQRDAYRGRDVLLLAGDSLVASGIASGVSATGELLVAQDGVLRPVNAGELSLRLPS